MPPITGAPKSLTVEPSPKRYRVFLGGQAIADSVACKLLFETGYQPVIYFPLADVAKDALLPTNHRLQDPAKGELRYWHVRAGGVSVENGAWGLTTPGPETATLAGHVSFEWNKMERWMEEDQALLGHARNPYSRIDTLPSTRAVTVEAGGRTLARSTGAVLVYETGHPMRPYIDRADIDLSVLRPSPTRTVCPYKGEAHYFNAVIDGREIKDIAWSYADPLPEVALIKDRLAFYPDRVDKLVVAAK